MAEHTSCHQGGAGTESSLDPLSTTLRSVTDCGQSPPSFHDAKTIMTDIKIRLARGPSGENWKEYHLPSHEWVHLKDLLAECELHQKVSYHYFSRTETFVHEMHTFLHSAISRMFGHLLLDGMVILSSEAQESNDFKDDIFDWGNGDILARVGSDLHQPDGYISHSMGGAGVIFEFAYSQKTKKLREAAQFYLLNGCVEARLVVGVDYDCANHTKKATLWTWKRDESDSPGGIKLREYVQELRSEDGTPIPGPDLQITMFDLAPADHVLPSLRHATINLSVDALCNMIQIAEGKFEDREQETRSLRRIVPDTGKPSQAVSNPVETDANEADPSRRRPLLLRSPIKTRS